MNGQRRRSTTADGYGYAHQQARARLLARDRHCHRCGAIATHADHVPPLDYAARTLGLTRAEASARYTTDGTGPYQLQPSCSSCNTRTGAIYGRALRALGLTRHTPPPPHLNRSRQW